MIQYQIRALRRALPKPVILYSTSVSSVEKRQVAEERKSVFVQQLSNEFQASKHFILKLRKDDAININFSVWKSHIYAMMKYGLSEIQCFEIIFKYPPILEIPLSKLNGRLLQWHQVQLRPDIFQLLLTNSPILLEVDEDVIKERIPRLRLHFKSSASLSSVLMEYPNVMFDNWDVILKKINYLLNGRGFKIGDLLQGDVLSNSLDFIKFRLDLLEKCGIYKENKITIHKENKYDKSRYQNPPLRDMLLKNIKKFVKIAKISEEEYMAFEELHMTEDDYEEDTDDE